MKQAAIVFGSFLVGGGTSLAYPLIKDTFFHEPKVTRPFRDLLTADQKCKGNAVALCENWAPHESYTCQNIRTRPVVLVQKKSPTNEEREVEVYLCNQHLRDAEAHHQWFAESFPERWQDNVFPMDSPNKRTYYHNMQPLDYRRSVPFYQGLPK